MESDGSSVQFDCLTGDCQSEAEASFLPRARLVQPVETLENPGPFRFRNAWPVVDDIDGHLPVAYACRPDLDPASRRGMPDRVMQDIGNSRAMWTSMTLSSGVARSAAFQTSRASIFLDTTCPW